MVVLGAAACLVGPGVGPRWLAAEGPVAARAAADTNGDPLPAGAYLYLLKNVLADWPDREALALLKRCAEAARPAGRLVVLSGVSPDAETAPSPELLMMVLVTNSCDPGAEGLKRMPR